MVTIHLTDQFGLDVKLDPDPASVFVKYVKGLTEANASVKDGKNISTDTVGDYPFTTQAIGVSFQQPVPLVTTDVELCIKPNVSGCIALSAGSKLLDKTLFDKPDAKPLWGQKYLSAALEASLAGDLTDKSGDLQFGFNAGSDVVLKYSQPVNATDELVSALKTTLNSFTIPGDLEDLNGMDEKSIASVKGTGTLTFTGAVNVLTVTNPLATIAAGIPKLGALTLQEGGSIGVTASLKFTGGYELQVSKLDANRILLAYSRMNGEALDVSITGEIGLSGGLGDFDLIKTLLQTVSHDLQPSVNDLKKAGLSDDEIAAICSAIKGGIQRSLQVALTAALDLSDDYTKAFLYEIDLSALDDAGKLAVHSAIDGNLSALESGNLTGVQALRSVIRATQERAVKLNLNLLGILNVGSVSDLLQTSMLVVDPDTGDITVMDKTTASNVGLTVSNLAKDGDKLRRILADGFLATCAYRTSQTGFRSNITSKCWAFTLHQSTNLDQIENYLNIAVGLGLMARGDADKELAEASTIRQFGRSILRAESSYDDALFRILFFDALGQIRPQDYYEKTGRQAMAATLAPGDPTNQARLLPLTSDDVWSKMSGGQTTFPTLFSGYNAVEIADIAGDYSIIKWWASAMHSLGQSLSNLLAFLNNSGVKDPNNDTFIALRGDLNETLKAVAQKTHDRFAEPWGLVAMDMASGGQSPTSLLITCPRLSLSFSSGQRAPLPGGAGAAH
jgi:hypothetical protein